MLSMLGRTLKIEAQELDRLIQHCNNENQVKNALYAALNRLHSEHVNSKSVYQDALLTGIRLVDQYIE